MKILADTKMSIGDKVENLILLLSTTVLRAAVFAPFP